MNKIWKAEAYFASFAGKKWSAVQNAKAAITRAHKEEKWGSTPFDHPDMADFWLGLRKCCDNTQQGQKALPPSLVRVIIQQWMGQQTHDAARNAFIAAVQTWGVKRISEVLNLCRKHIKVRRDGGFTLYIVKAKNDSIAAGQRVALPAKAGDGFDISRVVARFLSLTRELPSDEPLLQSTDCHGRWSGTPFSGDAWNKALRKALTAAGVHPSKLSKLSSHSLRKGGFTALVRADVPADCRQRIIGHKSSSSAGPYTCRPLADLAAASRLI